MNPYACLCLIQYSAAWCHIRLTLSDWPCSFWTLCENRDFVSLVILAGHYYDILMGAMASQITSFTSVNSIVYCGTNQRKHQSSASLAFVSGIHRWHSPHKGPVTRKMIPFDDVIMRVPFQISLDIWCVVIPWNPLHVLPSDRSINIQSLSWIS